MRAWIQSDEVTLVTVLEVPVIPVIVPLIQIPHVSDGVGVQPCEGLFHVFVFLPEQFSRSDGVRQQFTDDGEVCRTAVAGGAVVALVRLVFVLRRGTGCGDQLSRLFRVLDEPFQAEACRSFHQRVGGGAQIVLVLRKLVALPQRVHEPRAAEVPVRPLRTLLLLPDGVRHGPDVRVVARAPALVDAVVVARRVLSVGRQCLYEAVEGCGHLRHVRHECGPVVLLEVDVHGVVAAPGRPQVGCPESLQVRWHALGARRGDEQIAPILEVECLQVSALPALVGIVLQQHVGSLRGHGVVLPAESQLHAVVDGLVVSEVTLVELVVAVVLRVPQVVGGLFEIGCALSDGVLVEAVEARLVHDIDDSLLGVADGERRVLCRHLSVGLHREHRAEVDGLPCVAQGVSRHRDLRGDGLRLVGYLCRQCDLAVHVTAQSDGDELVGVRGEVLALDPAPVTPVAVSHDAAVEAEAPLVVGDGPQSEVLDVQRAQRLEVLRVRSLHVQLQRVRQLVVLPEEGLADLRDPLVGVLVEVAVHGFPCPERDVVQIDDVVVGTAVDECAELTVADG